MKSDARPKPIKFITKEKNMKKTVLRIVVTTFLLLALGATTAVADGVPAPMCWPERCPGQ
jgi:hypothetical protein